MARVFTVTETGREIDCSPAKVRELIHKGLLRAVWYGSHSVRVPEDAIGEFLASGGTRPVAEARVLAGSDFVIPVPPWW